MPLARLKPGSRTNDVAGRTAAAGGQAAVVAVLAVMAPLPAEAQHDTTHSRVDSLRIHRLSEVVIVAPARLTHINAYSAARVRPEEIALRDATSVADIVHLVPAAHLTTNSRGETLVYLRDAGERQVAVFFDGALLNVPWDNRVDLSLVPGAMIAGVTVAKGVPPVEYGANVIGGAVNLTSRAPELRRRTEVEALAGSAGRRHITAAHVNRAGPALWEVSLGHARADGWPLPGGVELPFGQADPNLRTNTDHRITNVFLRGAYDLDRRNQLGLSVLLVDAEKGVAPQGHLDPRAARVRYWRYPVWRNGVAILSGEGVVDGGTLWKAAAWVNGFTQQIDSYTSDAYDAFDSREEGDDLTFGSRVVLRRALGRGAIKFAANGFTSTHWQRETDLLPSGEPDGPPGPVLVFRQHVVSAGVEYETYPAPGATLTFGAGVDAMIPVRTGDKPDMDPFVDYTVTAGATRELGGGAFLRAAIGRKTRFPTMRELFGEALNRFLINPDLEPESSLLGELGLGIRGPRLSAEMIPFVMLTSNTIDQRNVSVPGEPHPRRQRINLPGSRVVGIELAWSARPAVAIQLDGHATLIRPRPVRETGTEPAFLQEKPEALARVGARYRPPSGFQAGVEAVYTGTAYSLDEDNTFVALPTSLVLNVRVGQTIELSGGRRVEVFGRADNVTDEVVVPQLGLPGPGRLLAAGVSLDL